MNKFNILFTGITLLCPAPMHCMESTDTTDAFKPLNGSIYSEVNYEYNSFERTNSHVGLPRVVCSLYLDLSRGWTIDAEFEYEQAYENGKWDNEFNHNFATNKIYVNKRFTDALQMKVGILEVPIGLTNRGGPALTIYDPESEAGIVPLTWHETGISLWGDTKRWTYSITGTGYISAPLNKSHGVGVAIRADYHITDHLQIGASFYTGTPTAGMMKSSVPEYIGESSLNYLSLDYDYQAKGFIIDGSLTYDSKYKTKAIGAEIGYDFFKNSPTMVNKFSLIPFIRYDKLLAKNIVPLEKWTIGTNISLLPNLIFKAEYDIRHHNWTDIERIIEFGLGYTILF